jgi:hypothetical protein
MEKKMGDVHNKECEGFPSLSRTSRHYRQLLCSLIVLRFEEGTVIGSCQIVVIRAPERTLSKAVGL